MTQSILDFLRNAIVTYGYWAVGAALLLENAGVPVPGETILLLASFLAYSENQLQLSWIIVVATVAATLGDKDERWRVVALLLVARTAAETLGLADARPALERALARAAGPTRSHSNSLVVMTVEQMERRTVEPTWDHSESLAMVAEEQADAGDPAGALDTLRRMPDFASLGQRWSMGAGR